MTGGREDFAIYDVITRNNIWINFVFIIVYLLLADVSLSFSQEFPADLSRLEGEWLNKEYCEKLETTRSPSEAVDGIKFTSLEFTWKKGKFNCLESYNFHEGRNYFISGQIVSENPDVYDIELGNAYTDTSSKSQCTIRFIRDEIEWERRPIAYEPPDTPTKYRYVRVTPDIQEYVNMTVLKGKYIDRDGLEFVFGHSGHAEWPEKRFIYKVSADYAARNDNFFFVYENTSSRRPDHWFTFQWQDERLLLYEILKDDDLYTFSFDTAIPSHVLTQLKEYATVRVLSADEIHKPEKTETPSFVGSIYPNPNSNMVLFYIYLPYEAHARLEMVHTNGSAVYTLFENRKANGAYEINIDHGHEMDAGKYDVRLIVDGEIFDTSKLLLIK